MPRHMTKEAHRDAYETGLVIRYRTGGQPHPLRAAKLARAIENAELAGLGEIVEECKDWEPQDQLDFLTDCLDNC